MRRRFAGAGSPSESESFDVDPRFFFPICIINFWYLPILTHSSQGRRRKGVNRVNYCHSRNGIVWFTNVRALPISSKLIGLNWYSPQTHTQTHESICPDNGRHNLHWIDFTSSGHWKMCWSEWRWPNSWNVFMSIPSNGYWQSAGAFFPLAGETAFGCLLECRSCA